MAAEVLTQVVGCGVGLELSDVEQEAVEEEWTTEECATVRIGEETMLCRGSLLCQHSLYCADRYERGELFCLKACSMDIFVLLYCWMRSQPESNHFILRPNTALRVLRAAQALQMPDLERECMHYLRPTGPIAERNAFIVFLEAVRMGEEDFKSLMVPRIATHFLPMVASDDFLTLSCDDVSAFLSSSNICVHCELEVYMAAVRWLSHNWATRRESTMRVMGCVRFELISPLHLIEIKYPSTPEFMFVIAEPHLQMLTRDAFWLSAILHTLGGGDNAMNVAQPLRYYDCTIPPPRQWYLAQKMYNQNVYQKFCILLLERQIASMQEESRELDEYREQLNHFLGEDREVGRPLSATGVGSLSTTGEGSALFATGVGGALSATGVGSSLSATGLGSALSATGVGSALSATGVGSVSATGVGRSLSTTEEGSVSATGVDIDVDYRNGLRSPTDMCQQ